MRFPALFAAIALLSALPAHAQSEEAPLVADTYDTGDWWWIDVSGNETPRSSLLLVNGTGVRKGDVVELEAFTVYRQPNDRGVIGGRIISHIDCAAETDAAAVHTLFYPDNQMREIPIYTDGFKPLNPDTVYFRFACTGNRDHAFHIGKGSRRAAAAKIFAEHPMP